MTRLATLTLTATTVLLLALVAPSLLAHAFAGLGMLGGGGQ